MKNVDLSTFFFSDFEKIQCNGTNTEQILKSTVINKSLMNV